MSAHIIDSQFLSRNWQTPEISEIFSDEHRLQCWLNIEAALAKVQGELGVIPQEAALAIVKAAKFENIDMKQYQDEAAGTGHILVPMIRCLQSACPGETGQWVYFGATTQDIVNTGNILQMREATQYILQNILRLEKAILKKASDYKYCVMAGRTHAQQASPITLGFKFATWAAEIRRDIERIKEFPQRVFMLSLHGAVGTQAAFGSKAKEITAGVARELNLTEPPICWATSRDGIAEFLNTMGILAGTLGRIANEIFSESSTEIGELYEPMGKKTVGSSTMPHKRNAGVSQTTVSQSRIVQANALLGMIGQVSEHERDLRSWRSEMHQIPETCVLMGRMSRAMANVLEGLEVNEKNIRRNLELLGSLLLTEAVMFRLADKMGKQDAHELLRELTLFQKDELTFIERLHANEKVKACLSDEEIDAIFDYSQFIGRAPEFVDQVIDYCREKANTDPTF